MKTCKQKLRQSEIDELLHLLYPDCTELVKQTLSERDVIIDATNEIKHLRQDAIKTLQEAPKTDENLPQ